MARDDSRTQDISVTTDTFLTIVTQANELLESLRTEIITANTAYGWTGTEGEKRNAELRGTFAANTLVAKDNLRGGNVTHFSTLLVNSNTNFDAVDGLVNFYSNVTAQHLNTGYFIIDTGNTSITSNTYLRFNDGNNAILMLRDGDYTDNVIITTTSLFVTSNTNNVDSNWTYLSSNTYLEYNDQDQAIVILKDNVLDRETIDAWANSVVITTDNTHIIGDTYIEADAGTYNINAVSDGVGSRVDIYANTMWLQIGNVHITGIGLHEIAGNVNFDTATLFVDSVNNEVGIGTDDPEAKFHIIQTDAIPSIRIDDQASDTTYFVVDQGGNTGIGIALPIAKLHVVNENDGDSFRIDDDPTDTTYFIIDKSGNTGIGIAAPEAKFEILNEHNEGHSLIINDQDFVVDSGGNTGIGMSGPIAKLDITSTNNGDSLRINVDDFVVDKDGNVGINSAVPDATLDVNGTANVSSNVWIGGNINVDGLTNTIEGNTLFDVDTLVVDGLNDKIGINKAIPVSVLDVVGNTHITGDTDIDSNLNVDGTVTWTKDNTTHLLSGNVNFDSATLFVNNSQNKVGIGITPGASSAKLQVSGTANVSSNVWIGGNNVIEGNVDINGIVHEISGNTNFNTDTLFVDSVSDGGIGRIGINTSSPDARLDVDGTANVSSNVWIGGNIDIDGNANIDGNATIDGTIVHRDNIFIDADKVSNINGNTIVFQFNYTNYKTGKFTAQVSRGSVYQCSEFIVAINSGTGYIVNYGTVVSNGAGDLGDFSISTNGTTAEIRYVPNGASNDSVTIYGQLFTA